MNNSRVNRDLFNPCSGALSGRSIEGFLVNIPPVSNRNQIQLIFLRIELIGDSSIITNALPESVNTLHPVMR
jgi:hypothetical protein